MATVPVRENERTEVIDTLRGFALLGIAIINLTSFASPGAPPGYISSDPLERGITAGILFLVESKFFTLFSMLFGLGFAIQMQRAEQRGERLGWRHVRRLILLGLFGLAHIALLWEGDILLNYAAIGLLLLAFSRVSDRTLFVWMALLFFIPLMLYLLGFGALAAVRQNPKVDAELVKAETEAVAEFEKEARKAEEIAAGPYSGQVLHRLRTYFTVVASLLAMREPTVLLMFLIGLYVGRRGILAQPEEHLPLLRSVRFWGLSLGLFFSALVTAGFLYLPLFQSMLCWLFFNQGLAGPILALGYAATLVLLTRNETWRWLLSGMTAAGRMPLTNYLMQSVLCTLIFQSFGLGLAGKVSGLGQLGISLAIFTSQMIASLLWLRAFQYGPMEWLWRTLTYGTWQPMSRP